MIYRLRILPLLSAMAALVLLSFSTWAASLSDIRLGSGLGENLQAQITLDGVSKQDLVRVSLAPDRVWKKAGIVPLPELAGLQFQVVGAAGGRKITLTGREPLREPVVELIIQAVTPQGTLQRWYTLLLDPPEEITKAATVVAVTQAEAPATGEQPTPTITNAPAEKLPPKFASIAKTPVEQRPERQPAIVPESQSTPAIAGGFDGPLANEPFAQAPIVVTPKPQPVPEASLRVAQPPVGSGFNPQFEESGSEVSVAATAEPERLFVPESQPAPEASSRRTQPPVSGGFNAQFEQPASAVAPVSTTQPEGPFVPAVRRSVKETYGPIKSGETLFSIANKIRPSDVTTSQAMAAILRTNPREFQGKPENLSVGRELYLPPKAVMKVLTDSEARAFIIATPSAKKPIKVAKRVAPRRTKAVAPKAAVKPVTKAKVVKRALPVVDLASDEALPIAETYPLDVEPVTAMGSGAEDSGVNFSEPDSTAGFDDLPIAETLSLTSENTVSTDEKSVVVITPTLPAVTFDRVVTVVKKPQSLNEKPVAPKVSDTSAEKSADALSALSEQRTAAQKRAEQARLLEQAAKSEIERVKKRQEELAIARAAQLKEAEEQAKKAAAEKLALENLLQVKPVDPAVEPTSALPQGNGSEEAVEVNANNDNPASETDPVAAISDSEKTEPKAQAVVGNVTAESPSTPPDNQAVEDENAVEKEVEAVEENLEEAEGADTNQAESNNAVEKLPASQGSSVDNVAVEEGDKTTAAESESVGESEVVSDDAEIAAQPITAEESQNNSEPSAEAANAEEASAEPVQQKEPVTTQAAEPVDTTNPSEGVVATVKGYGQQAAAFVAGTSAVAFAAMTNEPADLSPTDPANFLSLSFWADYFDRLKSGDIQAHNPILWALVLLLLLLWLVSKFSRRKEKFTEPKNYGDLDSKPDAKREKQGEKSAADVAAVAVPAAVAASLVSKDPLGDADFHIDYGMHAQALDIVRTAKQASDGELLKRLLFKEAEILVAQNDAYGLSILRQEQSENTELLNHIDGLVVASKPVEAGEPSQELSGSTEHSDVTDTSVEDVATLDGSSEQAADDSASDASSTTAVEAGADADNSVTFEEFALDDFDVEAPAESDTSATADDVAQNLVDFELDDLSVEEPVVEATPEKPADNNVDFDLDSLSAELDALEAQSKTAQEDAGGGDSVELSDNAIDELEALTESLNSDASIEDSGLEGLLSVEPISEPEKPAPAAGTEPAAEISFGDVLSTQLDLARAYVDMGDTVEATKLLGTVIGRGSDRQIAEAKRLLAELG